MFRTLAKQKECQVVEGHLMADHVHMLISIPPKDSVAQVIGYIKGKSAIYVARTFFDHKRSFVGQHFWARGYFVSTVGRDEATIREYIRNQEVEDKRQEQLKLQQSAPPLGGSRAAHERPKTKPPWAAHEIMPPALPGDTYSRKPDG